MCDSLEFIDPSVLMMSVNWRLQFPSKQFSIL